jgi:hypothetical protein
MTDRMQKHRDAIAVQLNEQYSDLKPKIARINESDFIYELEKHGNFTYYSVRYHFSSSDNLIIDWETAELTVY